MATTSEHDQEYIMGMEVVRVEALNSFTKASYCAVARLGLVCTLQKRKVANSSNTASVGTILMGFEGSYFLTASVLNYSRFGALKISLTRHVP